jgi:flagellar biogenesis protein FliO
VRLVQAALVCFALALPAIAHSAAPAESMSQAPASAASNGLASASASASAAAPHTAIPFKQEKQSTDTLAYQSFAALVLVGLAAYGIVFGLKRFGWMGGGPIGKARRVRTVDAIRLGRRSMLFVVEYQGKELLLAESEHGVQLLLDGPIAPAAAAPAQSVKEGAANA